MMERVLAADEIKTVRGKRQCRAVAVHPGNVWHFAQRLAQHAECAVEADKP